MIKSNKGITLIALTVTIIIILILVSTGTYYGASSIRSSNFERFRSQMQTIQLKVNELYEEYRSTGSIRGEELTRHRCN